MGLKLKHFLRSSIIRLIATLLSFIVQFTWLWFISRWLKSYSTWVSLATNFFVAALVVHIYNKQNYSISLKVPWLILILVLPIVGITLYALSESNHLSHKIKANTEKIRARSVSIIPDDSSIIKAIEKQDKRVANQFRYLSQCEHFPAFFNTGSRFFGNTVECLSQQLKDLAAAKKFIFMEYHAVENARAFGQILEVLKDRIAAGVEVRLLFDDVGSIGYINRKFVTQMRSLGIQCKDFNPVSPIFSLFMNNRDHRKIMVIDGKVAFTGGYNLADEYFNYTHPYGQWKDCGIRIEGKAVNSFTEFFLEMWNSWKRGEMEDVSKYFIPASEYEEKPVQGFVQPYTDNPLYSAYIGENVYLNIIKWAQNYVYITTPYLILGDEMKRELTLAAMRGVDVRIITPGIPDKKIVFKMTRSFYGELIDGGVKIYEYAPGFIHAKQMLADGQLAAVGTVNMDFRSFHHNFENGVLMYNNGVMQDMEKDFDSLFEVCTDVTEKYHGKKHHSMSFTDRFLRLFCTLL